MFDHGLDLFVNTQPLGFQYGPDSFGPAPETRKLDAIRKSLRDPSCVGPEDVYSIAMDVGRPMHLGDLKQRHLLFGVVAYAPGRLGDEPIRSQGHIHKPSPRNGWSTPEVYEVWQGRAVILMQERCEPGSDDPGRCFAVSAGPGEVVVVPPSWAHATISADPDQPLVFGAWCDRAYGFVYDGVRAHGGLAWFPLLDAHGGMRWEHNPQYRQVALNHKPPRVYHELGIDPARSIYRQYTGDPSRFDFVPNPQVKASAWSGFVP